MNKNNLLLAKLIILEILGKFPISFMVSLKVIEK